MKKQAIISAIAASALLAVSGIALAQSVGSIESLRGAQIDEHVAVPLSTWAVTWSCVASRLAQRTVTRLLVVAVRRSAVASQ